jgi:sugar O-acyltransferase (sialic acid O-acetyltransferase NeuD family)
VLENEPLNIKRYLVGYSGHSYPIIEALHAFGFKFDGYFEGKEKGNNPYQIQYLGNENNFHFSNLDRIFVAIGDNYLRRKVVEKLDERVAVFSIIDSNSIVRSVISKEGILVNAGAVIQPQCSIGKGVIVNTRSVVEHECIIGDYVHIGPGAVVTGNVTIGENTFIGANATILPGLSIGKNCIIGAGSVVTKNVNDNSVLKGNPAK